MNEPKQVQIDTFLLNALQAISAASTEMQRAANDMATACRHIHGEYEKLQTENAELKAALEKKGKM